MGFKTLFCISIFHSKTSEISFKGSRELTYCKSPLFENSTLLLNLEHKKNSLVEYMTYFCGVLKESQGSIKKIWKYAKINKLLISSAWDSLLANMGCNCREEKSPSSWLKGVARLQSVIKNELGILLHHECDKVVTYTMCLGHQPL